MTANQRDGAAGGCTNAIDFFDPRRSPKKCPLPFDQRFEAIDAIPNAVHVIVFIGMAENDEVSIENFTAAKKHEWVHKQALSRSREHKKHLIAGFVRSYLNVLMCHGSTLFNLRVVDVNRRANLLRGYCVSPRRVTSVKYSLFFLEAVSITSNNVRPRIRTAGPDGIAGNTDIGMVMLSRNR